MGEISQSGLLSEIKGSLSHQLKAALNTLGHVVESCPDSEWQRDHGDAPFSQVVFHTLFYADFYLGRDTLPFRDQAFHMAHTAIFADYEEMEDRKPVRLYEKAFCRDYLGHCIGKVDAMMEAETLETLAGDSGIDFRHCSRMELYIYGERHIQHHAAQLGLRIQQVNGKELKWYSGHGTSD
jgi:hypothetical protein